MISKKSTLCIDARMYNHSGIGKYLQMLLPCFCDVYETTLLGYADQLSSLGPVANIIPFEAPIYSIGEQRNFRRVATRADLFWSPHYNVPLMPLKSKKRIVTIHDVYHLAFYNQLSRKQKLYARAVLNSATKLSDQVITVSNFSKKEIEKYTGCKSSKIQVVYNGVKQQASYQDETAVAGKYNLPDKYILFVGNVKPHKNLKALLQAYLLLNTGLKQEYKIVIVGKRDGFVTGDEELTHWINAHPEIQPGLIFTGYVAGEDMDTIYKKASLFVFPSKYEGFGLPPLEAMLNDCPVISSNAASLPEICGDAVVYFNPDNASELSGAITKVLTGPELHGQLKKDGQTRIKDFTWDYCAAKHIEIFNRTIAD